MAFYYGHPPRFSHMPHEHFHYFRKIGLDRLIEYGSQNCIFIPQNSNITKCWETISSLVYPGGKKVTTGRGKGGWVILVLYKVYIIVYTST